MYNSSNRNFGLDVLRAIAIILVVASHCTYLLPEFNQQLTNAIRLLGATGVDLFFVLSGYLIGGIIIKNLSSGKTKFKDLLHFWKRRWLRTLPNYFVVLFLNVILLFILNEPLIKKVWLYIPFLQNFATPHPDFFTEAWSLSIEEYAYLILPAFIYSSIYILKSKKSVGIFVWTTIITIFILFLFKYNFYKASVITDYKDWSSSFRKVVLYRLDAIYYGFLAAYLISKYSFKSFRYILLLVGAIIFVALHLLIISFNIMPNEYQLFYSLFYLPLISFSIAFVFPWFLNLKGYKSISKVITYISKRSYAIYLVNYSLVLLTIERFWNPSIWVTFIYILVTLIASEVLFILVERPALIFREQKVPNY